MRSVLALLCLLRAAEASAQSPPAAQLTKPPHLTRFVEAKPPAALETRRSAEVVLAIDLDATGKVVKIEVLAPAGEGFDEAATEAAQQFVFEPGEYQGKPVPVRITYRYRFTYTPLAPTEPSATHAPPMPTAPFAGRVLRKGDRTPLEGISLVLDQGEPNAKTDADGRFEIATVPLGDHAVHLRGPGITPSDGSITVRADKRLEVTYYVTAKERYASTVRAQRVVEETVEQTLAGDELRRIPGTQGDTLKAVQNLPGVARSPFGGGLLVVWGSAPLDTRTYVDGVYIPTLYHFGGLRSTFNGEMVQSLTFLPGGYGVEYGRGLGGAINIRSRRPRTDAPHGFVQMDLFDGSFLFDGPLSKNLSLSIGGRRSWIDAFLPLFTTNDFQLEPIYWDYQANLHWRATPRDDIDFLVFGSDDTIHLVLNRPDPVQSPTADSHTFYHRLISRWLHRFEKGTTAEATASAGYDVPLQLVLRVGNTTRTFDIETFSYNLRAVVRVPVRSWLRVDAGLDFEGNRWGPIQLTFGKSGPPREGDPGGFGGGLAGPSGLATDDYTLSSNQLAPFLTTTFFLFDKRLVVAPQLRLEMLSYSAYQGTPAEFSNASFLVEPRLTARFQVRPWLAPKLAVGLYHQPPSPLDFSNVFGNTALAPETGLHYVAGVDFDPTHTLHIEVEGFYKDLRNMVVRGEHLGDPLLTNDGTGRVYGGELLVRRELAHNFFGWISYTFSRSERRDHPDTPWRLFQYDQTHILTLIGSYLLPRGYQLGLRFRYVTGNPTTPLVGAYFDASVDRYTPIWGGVYSSRLGGFHQLDLRFDKVWTFNRWKLSLYVDLQNVYNRKNPEGIQYNFDFSRTQPQAGLPFLPVLGVRGEL